MNDAQTWPSDAPISDLGSQYIYIYVYIYDMNRASVNEHQARSEVNGYFPLVDLQHGIGYVHFASLPLVPPAPPPIPFADSHAALG